MGEQREAILLLQQTVQYSLYRLDEGVIDLRPSFFVENLQPAAFVAAIQVQIEDNRDQKRGKH